MDDGCEVEVFTGPTARRQPLRYAVQRYGTFRDVQLEQYARSARSSCSGGAVTLESILSARLVGAGRN